MCKPRRKETLDLTMSGSVCHTLVAFHCARSLRIANQYFVGRVVWIRTVHFSSLTFSTTPDAVRATEISGYVQVYNTYLRYEILAEARCRIYLHTFYEYGRNLLLYIYIYIYMWWMGLQGLCRVQHSGTGPVFPIRRHSNIVSLKALNSISSWNKYIKKNLPR